ncbi:MAG: hypothetical protein JWL76_2250 [Thermoleophilia bacterium]|nr:hypothetical protein [Thermoleophilia bacterium]
MEPIRPSMIVDTLRSLGGHADELARIEVPVLFSGIVDRTSAYGAVQRALSDAELAAAQVAQLHGDPKIATDVNVAVRMLEHAPLDEIALRDVGMRLRTHLDTMRASGPLHDEFVRLEGRELFEQGTTASWTVDDLALLERSLADAGALEGLPRELVGARPLAELVADSAKAGSVDVGIQRYVDAWTARTIDPTTHHETATRLLTQAPASLQPADWATLRTQLDVGAGGPVAAVAAQLDGVRPFHQAVASLADGSTGALAEATRAIHDWRSVRRPVAERRAELVELLSHEATDLSAEQWRTIASHLEAGDAEVLRNVTPELSDAKPLQTIARSVANGEYAPGAATQRYFSRFQFDSLDPDTRIERAGSMLRREPEDLSPDQWRQLDLMLGDADTAAALGVPLELPDAKPLRSIATSVAAGEYKPGAATRRYFDLFRVNSMPETERRAAIAATFAKHSSELSTDEWRQLAAFIDHEPSRALIDVAVQLDGAEPLATIARTIAAGSAKPGAAAQRYFDQATIAALSPAQRTEQLASLLGRSSTELTTEDWTKVVAILDDPTTRESLTMPLELDDAKPLRTIAASLAADEYKPGVATQRYFDLFQVSSMPEAEQRAQVAAILAKHSRDVTTDEWRRLATFIDHEPTRGFLGIDVELDGAKPLRDIARSIAAGEYPAGAATQRYFEQAAIAATTPAQRQEQLASLLGRHSSELSNEEWMRVVSLLDDPATRDSLGIPLEISDAKPLRTIAASLAASEYKPGAATQRYFDLFRVSRMTEAEQRATIAATFAKHSRDVTKEEWTTLATLIEHPKSRPLLGIDAEIEGAKPLAQIARSVAAGEYEAGAATQRYFEQATIAATPPAQRQEQLASLLGRNPDELSSEEWTRIVTLLDDPTTRESVTIPLELPSAKPLRTIAASVAAGEYKPGAATKAYFDAFAVSRMTPEARTVAIDSIFAGHSRDVSKEDWGRLVALIDSGGVGEHLGISVELDGAKSLREIAAAVAKGEYEPGAATQRYFDAFALQRLTPEARMAEASALFSRNSADLSTEDWGRLAALLDDEATRVRTQVPMELENAKPLRTIARSLANAEYKPGEATQRYFVEWQRRNDPAYQARLEAALADITSGGASPESRTLVAEQWDRLAELVAGRPAAEQAAIAEVMMGLDSVAGSRSVKSTLELLLANMPPAEDVPAALVATRNETVALIERNLARLDGSTPTGAVRGYSNHPDYAEIGRIRANTSFLQEAMRLEPAAEGLRPQPGVAADAATGVAADEVATASAGETLTW